MLIGSVVVGGDADQPKSVKPPLRRKPEVGAGRKVQTALFGGDSPVHPDAPGHPRMTPTRVPTLRDIDARFADTEPVRPRAAGPPLEERQSASQTRFDPQPQSFPQRHFTRQIRPGCPASRRAIKPCSVTAIEPGSAAPSRPPIRRRTPGRSSSMGPSAGGHSGRNRGACGQN